MLRLRSTEEPIEIVAVLDASGTMLVRDAHGGEFEVRPDDVETPEQRHACCGAC